VRAAPPPELKPLERPLDRAEFLAEVDAWAKRIGVRPTQVTVRPMKRKWGSCSTAGRLTFDTGLFREHVEFRKRVIVEELLHLRTPGHGKVFKALLRSYVGGPSAAAE